MPETGRPDLVAAYLAEAGQHRDDLKAAKAAYAPRGELLPSGAAGEWVIACIAAAYDHASLLGAVEAVLAIHKGHLHEDYPQERPMCRECGEWSPCPTETAIAKALTEDEANG